MGRTRQLTVKLNGMLHSYVSFEQIMSHTKFFLCPHSGFVAYVARRLTWCKAETILGYPHTCSKQLRIANMQTQLNLR